MSRRLLIAALLGVLLFSTPALAGLTITDRQQASTDLITGPQFFAFGTGTDVVVGATTNWAGFELEGLEVDDATGDLVLGRAGDVAPSAIAWHDEPSTTRACETDGAQNVRAVQFDAQREIDAGRLRADLADIRVFDTADGVPVAFRTGTPEATSVVVDTTTAAEPVAVCVYWGSGSTASLSDASVEGPVVADGGWSWSVWENVGDGLSLDLVDWSTPSATGSVPTAAVPADVCNQCSNELVGFVTPAVTGTYRFYLSADEVGRLEIAPLDDPSALATVIELSTATASGDFSDPAQATAPIDLVAGQSYAIRARSKDLEAADHLEIAWAIEGDAPTILPTEVLSDSAGTPGSLTHHRFDLVETADRSGEPNSTTRIEATETVTNTCDSCAHAVSGYVVLPETGTYRFWISSDDEGSLQLATDGNPSSATRVAWLTNFTEPSNWIADPSQRSAPYELQAGQTIWIEAHSRDRGGNDHLQVAWTRDDVDPAADPALLPAEVLSESQPVEDALPTGELGEIEGQQAASGSFVSAAVDTTTGGSNVFGRFVLQAAGAVEVEVSFANDPAGPWTEPTLLRSQAPAPLAVDELRYVRFAGELTSSGVNEAMITLIGVERDLVEAASNDATSNVTATADGDQAILRVRGSVGAPSTAQVATTGVGSAAFSLESASSGVGSEASFGNGESHHIVVSAVPSATTASGRWSTTEDRGAIVVHDIDVVFE